MSYRDDIAALEARVTSLHRETSDKVDELERTQALVAEARRRVRGHVLDAELATPCTASWDDMNGNERVRHCSHCNKNVYNFAELDRDQINRLIMINEGKLCARFFMRADGTVVTKDCKLDIRVRPLRRAAEIGIAAAAAAALAAAGGAFVDGHRPPPPQEALDRYMDGGFVFSAPPLDEDYQDHAHGGQAIAVPLDDAAARIQAIEEARRVGILGGVEFQDTSARVAPEGSMTLEGGHEVTWPERFGLDRRATLTQWHPATSPEVLDGANFTKREAKRQKAASSGPSFDVPKNIEPK